MVTSTVKGDAGLGSSSTAVWDSFTYLYDDTKHAQYLYNIRRFAFDRRTAQLVNCCGANVNGNSSIRQTGLVGFLWPFGTQRQTYQVFDPGMNKAAPARYTGTTTVNGISVYRFVEKVTGVQIGTQTVPSVAGGHDRQFDGHAAGVPTPRPTPTSWIRTPGPSLTRSRTSTWR